MHPQLASPTSNASGFAGNTSVFQTVKRQQASKILSATTRQAFQTRRAYSSEIAQAMVEVSKNLGMGTAAVGLTGAGIGIGLVFASLLSAVARNPALRGQLFSYAILGFAFVEAIGLFDLMVALMAKFVRIPGAGQKSRRPNLSSCLLTCDARPKRRTSPHLRRLGSHDHVAHVRSDRVAVPRGMSVSRYKPCSIGIQHRLIEALRQRRWGAWRTIEGRLCIA